MDFFRHQQDGASSDTNQQAFNFNGDGDCPELKEQDLIRQLEEKDSNTIGGSGFVLDCTLTLGPSGLRLRQIDHPNHARTEQLLYVPVNSHGHKQATTTTGSHHKWNGYSGCMPRAVDFFGAYGSSLMVDANGYLPPMAHNSIANLELRNMHKSKALEGNVGVGGREGTTFRKCSSCQTTATPLWRNGPNGSKSLCNACGIRYKKEERRAHAAAAAARPDIGDGGQQGNLA